MSAPVRTAIGAEVTNVHLGEASRNPELFAQIKSALLKHKVLFFRNQEITRGDHEAFAKCFGKLEDHPVLDCDPQHPGVLLIHRGDNRHSPENVYHSDGLWRPKKIIIGRRPTRSEMRPAIGPMNSMTVSATVMIRDAVARSNPLVLARNFCM